MEKHQTIQQLETSALIEHAPDNNIESIDDPSDSQYRTFFQESEENGKNRMGKKRRSAYICSKCNQTKKGHICTV